MSMPTTTRQSDYSYDETIARLSKAIIGAGNTVFATIDQAAAARAVGLSLRPTTLLVFGNPKGGTPLMDAFPLFALELPLKLVVWEEAGQVNVSAMQMAAVAEQYDLNARDVLVTAMDHALGSLLDSLSG